MTEYVEALLTMLPATKGGRASPIYPRGVAAGSHYMPHFRVGETGEYLGVAFVGGPECLSPGESAIVTVTLFYAGRVDYSQLVPGASFSVLEGNRVVAHGEVLRR
jgi:hypothetical protein